jgi:hypothetical protein
MWAGKPELDSALDRLRLISLVLLDTLLWAFLRDITDKAPNFLE